MAFDNHTGLVSCTGFVPVVPLRASAFTSVG